MSYDDLPAGDKDRELGKAIYMCALEKRKGFRNDQLGIFDDDIWAEIFDDMGRVARAAVAKQAGS